MKKIFFKSMVSILLILTCSPGMVFATVEFFESDSGNLYRFDSETKDLKQIDRFGNTIEDLSIEFQGSNFSQDNPTSFLENSRGQTNLKKGSTAISKGVISEMGQMTKKMSLNKFAIGSSNELEFYNPSKPENSFLDKIIKFIAITIGTFSVLAMSVGAYFLVIANGDQNQITKGKSIMTYALIGVVVSFSAYYIIGFAVTLFSRT